MGRIKVPPLRISEGSVAINFSALRSGNLFPVRIASSPVLPAQAGPYKGRSRLVIQDGSHLRRSQRIFNLLSHLISKSTGQHRSIRIRRRIISRVFRLTAVGKTRSVARYRSVLPARKVIKRGDVGPFFERVFLPLCRGVNVGRLRADFRRVCASFVFQLPRGSVRFLLVGSILRVEGRRLKSVLELLQDLFPGCLICIGRGWEIIDRSSFSRVGTRGWLVFLVGHGGVARGYAQGLSGDAWGLSVSDFSPGMYLGSIYLGRGASMGLRCRSWQGGA